MWSRCGWLASGNLYSVSLILDDRAGLTVRGRGTLVQPPWCYALLFAVSWWEEVNSWSLQPGKPRLPGPVLCWGQPLEEACLLREANGSWLQGLAQHEVGVRARPGSVRLRPVSSHGRAVRRTWGLLREDTLCPVSLSSLKDHWLLAQVETCPQRFPSPRASRSRQAARQCWRAQASEGEARGRAFTAPMLRGEGSCRPPCARVPPG